MGSESGKTKYLTKLLSVNFWNTTQFKTSRKKLKNVNFAIKVLAPIKGLKDTKSLVGWETCKSNYINKYQKL